MNKVSVVVIVILLLALTCTALLLGFRTYQNSGASMTASPLPSPTHVAQATASPSTTPSPLAFCVASNLQARIALHPGAGNIYGDATIKNIGTSPCQIVGNNKLQVHYPATTKNITTTYKAASTSAMYTIQPNASVYSQVHYLNGPQCSSTIVQVPVTFTYLIAPATPITFDTTTGASSFLIATCQSPTELSPIDLWPITATPITP